MLLFAYWAGFGGLLCSLAMALLACAQASIASTAAPYIALFVSIFVTFAPAIMAHPACQRSGGRFTLAPSALLAAELWTILLLAAMVVGMCASAYFLGHGADHFSIDHASLSGRIDRQLLLSFFFATFHACALCSASSGLRWGLLPAAPLGGAWLARLMTPPLALGTPSGLPGGPLSYRTASVSWFVILLEVAGALYLIFGSGSPLQQFLPFPHANLLALLLLALPVWHLLLGRFGKITFQVSGECLETLHFPFVSRNRRFRISDIRGIQVNSEVDDKGEVKHYSLLLIRDRDGTDRLVDKLPSAEHARILAQQIDFLIRLRSAGIRAA